MRAGGFVRVPNAMLHDPSLSANAKLMLIVLMSYAFGNKTEAYPSQATLATLLRWSVRKAQRTLKELVRSDLIVIKQRGLDSNLYDISPVFRRYGRYGDLRSVDMPLRGDGVM